MTKWNMTINNHLLIHKHRLASLLKIPNNYKTCGLHGGFEWFWQLDATTQKRFQVHLVILFWHDFYSRMSGSLAAQLHSKWQPGDMLTAMGQPNPHMGFNSCGLKETTKWEKQIPINQERLKLFQIFLGSFCSTPVTLMFLLKRCLSYKMPGCPRTCPDP